MRRFRILWASAAVAGVMLTLVAAAAAFTGRTAVALGATILLLGEGVALALAVIWLLVRLDRQAGRQARATKNLHRAIGRVHSNVGSLGSLVRSSAGGTRSGAEDERISVVERRYLEAFEAERLRAADRHREVSSSLGALESGIAGVAQSLERVTDRVGRAATSSGLDKVVREVRNTVRGETSEIEALLQIVPGISAPTLLPPSGQWAMNARSIAHLLDVVGVLKPRRVLELGGGTSTIWLGHTLAATGATIVSVDHDAHYAERTRRQVELHRLSDVVDVRVAPLTSVDVNGEEHAWYDHSAFSDVQDIDLLVIDGPPKKSGELARWPALPLLASQLDERAVIVLDDADRPDELEAIRRWTEALPGLRRHDEGVSRLAVLRRD